MDFRLTLSKQAVDDILDWRKADKNTLRKIDRLFLDIEHTPYTGLGKPEPLRHEMSGCWSRRINAKDRIVYKVDEQAGIITIISVKGHYSR